MPDLPAAVPDGALRGRRVLALEQLMAAPYGTQLLADFGAEVVGVEAMAHQADESVPWRLRTGRHKRRILVNLQDERGRALVRRLARRADAVVENFRPGVLDRYGLGYQRLRRRHRALVYVSVSGFGHPDFLPSPYSDLATYGPIAEAMGCVTWSLQQGGSGGDSGLAVGDVVSGLFAAVGLLIALADRDRTGQGRYVDVSMADCMLALAEYQFVRAMMAEAAPAQVQPGTGIVKGVHPAADGEFNLIVISGRHWAALARAIGREDWVAEGWLQDPHQRQARLQAEVLPSLHAWSGGRDRATVLRELRAAGLAAAPVNDPAAAAADPHFAAREMVAVHQTPEGRRVRVPGNPIKMSRAPAAAGAHRIAEPGADTERVLEEWLDLTPRSIASLVRSGVVGVAAGGGA